MALIRGSEFDARRKVCVAGLLMIASLVACGSEKLGSAFPTSTPTPTPTNVIEPWGSEEDPVKTAELRTYLRLRYGVLAPQAAWYPHITKIFVGPYALIYTDFPERNGRTDGLIRELCQRVLEFGSLRRVDVFDAAERGIWACQDPNN